METVRSPKKQTTCRTIAMEIDCAIDNNKKHQGEQSPWKQNFVKNKHHPEQPPGKQNFHSRNRHHAGQSPWLLNFH